jgi:hypothetical protein
LIKKINRSSVNVLSKHIFLYEAVISSNFGNIPVTQMLSEKQDTLTIFYWLGQWIMLGIRSPYEVVCDYSKAILGAASKAFCNGRSLQNYVNDCFKALNGHDEYLPTTYIRIDVAHVIKIFCRIKHFSGIKNNSLKQFYVRGIRLLLTSDTFKEFNCILEALFTIILSETDGRCVGKGIIETPSEISRQLILENIRGLSSEKTLIYDIEADNDLKLYVNDENDENIDNYIHEEGISHMDEYLKQIYEKS